MGLVQWVQIAVLGKQAAMLLVNTDTDR